MSRAGADIISWSDASAVSLEALAAAGFDTPSIEPAFAQELAAAGLSLQFVQYPEGYVAAGVTQPGQALPEAGGQPALTAGPGQALAVPGQTEPAPKYHASVGWRHASAGLVTQVRTLQPHSFEPRVETVINPYTRSIDICAREVLGTGGPLPEGTEVSLTLRERAVPSSDTDNLSALMIRIPGQPKNFVIDLISYGKEGAFTRIDVMGPRDIGKLLLGRGIPIHDIGPTQAGLRSETDVKQTLAALSDILGVSLTQPLDRRKTAERVLAAMGNNDFSLLQELVFVGETNTPKPAGAIAR